MSPRVRYRAYKGNTLQEEAYSSQHDVQEAKVILYRKLLQEGKLTHVEVRVPGQSDTVMIPTKGKEGK